MILAEPAFLFFLLLVPLLALGAVLAGRQRKIAWQKLVAPRLRKKLAAPASPWSRWLSLGCGLFAFTLLTICLSQPIAGEAETTSLVKGRNIIIAVDASRSMLVRDVAPDRLNAAKTAVYELLERFPNDRIGLLAFAGSASLQAPLTVDHNALRETLDQLYETNVPSGGSNLADAINLATRTFKETGQSTHGLIVISDGELHEGELEDASLMPDKQGSSSSPLAWAPAKATLSPTPRKMTDAFEIKTESQSSPVSTPSLCALLQVIPVAFTSKEQDQILQKKLTPSSAVSTLSKMKDESKKHLYLAFSGFSYPPLFS